MRIKVKIKCPHCKKKIKLILNFGRKSAHGYPETNRLCPHCNCWFGITNWIIYKKIS